MGRNEDRLSENRATYLEFAVCSKGGQAPSTTPSAGLEGDPGSEKASSWEKLPCTLAGGCWRGEAGGEVARSILWSCLGRRASGFLWSVLN